MLLDLQHTVHPAPCQLHQTTPGVPVPLMLVSRHTSSKPAELKRTHARTHMGFVCSPCTVGVDGSWPLVSTSLCHGKVGDACWRLLQVSLGTNAAYVYSVISIVQGAVEWNRGNTSFVTHDFLETSALLITFITCGG